MKPEERKAQIEEAKSRIGVHERELREMKAALRVLVAGCTAHQIIENAVGGAVCWTCGTHYGWYCEESPEGVCDYDQEDGSYDEDNCRHCGMPEERK